jgi:hypothetical protein
MLAFKLLTINTILNQCTSSVVLSLLMVRITINSGLIDRVKFNLVMFHFCGFAERELSGLFTIE